MSASSYYDKAASQEETSHFAPTSGQQTGPMHSGSQGYGQDMRQDMRQDMNEQQQQHGFPQQQSGNGVYNGQEPNMGNTNHAQGAQQMQDHGAQGAVADDRDTITKCNDNPPDYKNINFRKCLFNESSFQHAVK